MGGSAMTNRLIVRLAFRPSLRGHNERFEHDYSPDSDQFPLPFNGPAGRPGFLVGYARSVAQSSSVTVRLQRATAAGRTASALVMAMAATFGLDALLFRTPLYPSVIEPDSAAGQFELTLMREQRAQQENGGNMVVTLGDSRMSYLPRLSNELTPETGYVFRNAGIPGSDLRTWYYMIRELDPTRRRYRAIVIGVNDYDDEDTSDQPDDDLRSLH